jgi:hypothetical protein
MKKVYFARLTKFSFLLSFLLILTVLLSGALPTLAEIKHSDRTIEKSKKNRAGKSYKKRKTRKKFRANKKRKNFSAKFQQPKTEEEFEGDAERREDWFLSQRMYPYTELPEDARRRAWLTRPAEARRDGDAPLVQQWQSIGPKPTTSYFPNNWGLTSGRINAIAVSPSNPQLILVGAATGGIWRSTDGGENFAPTSDDQVDLAVGSIAFAPSNNSIVYAGMGDKASSYLGTGILKSIDGGQTWTRVNNTTLPSPGRVSKIEVDPANPNRVFVAQYSVRQGNSTFSSGILDFK